jgi:hydrogenase expression/formation protein HypE
MTTTIDRTTPGAFACPAPLSQYEEILLAHGGGGKLTQDLVTELFLPELQNNILKPLHDGAQFSVHGSRFAFTTDSYVVSPIFFPGGDIGSLAVNGTVNDLAMCGAIPLYLSLAFILEEGFPVEELRRIVQSIGAAARKAGVLVVTGDTKVVDRGKGDRIFINTSGIGLVRPGIHISPRHARPGDAIIVSGRIGMHGIAIMSLREGLRFQSPVESDSAALHDLVDAILREDPKTHVLRDPTRGGIASALNEIARSANVGIALDEECMPVSEEVLGACEILGLDPLYLASEGRLLAFVAPSHAETVLHRMRVHPLGRDAAVIGRVVADHPGMVVLKTNLGGERIVDMLTGEQLPRIC